MIDSVGPTISALNAYRKKMDVTANNIANVNTDDFKKSRVTFQEGHNGGVEAVVDRVDTPGVARETIHEDGLSRQESSNVDLAEELPEMMIARSGYGANLKALRAKNDMIGSTLDILS